VRKSRNAQHYSKEKMAKPKDAKTTEYYLGIIRDQAKQIRQLEKIVKSLRKSAHLYNDILSENEQLKEEDIPLPPKKKRCPECGKSDLIEFELIGRLFERCDLCGFRKKIETKT
jgi:hypothetical protein